LAPSRVAPAAAPPYNRFSSSTMTATHPSPLAIEIVTHALERVRMCSDDEILLLRGDQATEARHGYLMELRDRRQWLHCSGGRLLHPVRGPRAFLRHQTDDIPPPGLGCWLCEREPAGPHTGDRGDIVHPGRGLGLVLDTPVWNGST